MSSRFQKLLYMKAIYAVCAIINIDFSSRYLLNVAQVLFWRIWFVFTQHPSNTGFVYDYLCPSDNRANFGMKYVFCRYHRIIFL